MLARRSTFLAPLLVLVLTVAAIAAVWLLIGRADSSRGEQLRIGAMMLSLSDLQSAPFNAEPSAGGDPAASRAEIKADQSSIAQGLMGRSQSAAPRGLLIVGRARLAAIEPLVAEIYRIAIQRGGLSASGARVASLQKLLTSRSQQLAAILKRIGTEDAASAARARSQAKLGAGAAMLLLLLAFSYVYFRALNARAVVERLAKENESLLGVSRIEARTDALTGLGNRRALTNALTIPSDGSQEHELLFAMFDLDGFKQYNDSFGHAAGDALLQRLGNRLASVTGEHGSAYRMGGDEFCLLARCRADAAEQLLNDAVFALEDRGDGWRVGCSHGAVWVPSEASSESDALKRADERMYANKASRSSASRQATDVLLQVITEQDVCLDHHVTRVSELAGRLAEALGLPEHQVQQIRLAANLHDVGKIALPGAILKKPGPLSDSEWEFMRRHPLIGERIALAAPALAHVAPLIRSSHERLDGKGYPDGLSGDAIALGSRIIAVCDAFDAMTSPRPYRHLLDTQAALDELERHAGTQFDRALVRAFVEVASEPAPAARA